MADPNLLVDVVTTSSQAATATFTDVTALASSAAVAGTGSVCILMAVVTLASGGGDASLRTRFAVDGSAVGPTWICSKDHPSRLSSVCMLWAVDGLSAASHDFDVQINEIGSSAINVNIECSLQVVELTAGASILVEATDSTARTTPATFADITSMAATVTPAADAAHIFTYGETPLGGVDPCASHQFAIDGTRDGPMGGSWCDSTSVVEFSGLIWFTDALANSSQTLSVQWEIRVRGAPGTESGSVHGFQVIEITDDVALTIDKTLTSADSAASTMTQMADMTGSPTIDSVNSVSLVNASWLQNDASADNAASYELTVGGVQEGPRARSCSDNTDAVAGNGIIYGITGESGVTAIDLDWQYELTAAATDVNFDRVFQILEFKAAAVGALIERPLIHSFAVPRAANY